MTFAGVGRAARTRGAARAASAGITDETPPLVMRAKAHGAMLRIIADRQAALAAWCRAQLATRAGGQGRAQPRCWRPGTRTQRARSTRASPRWRSWVRDGDARSRDAQRAGERGPRAARRARATSIGRVGGAAHRSRGAGRRASPATRPGCSRRASSTTSTAGASRAIACARRERRRATTRAFALDAEDDALLLRIYQRQRGRLPGGAQGRRSPTST